MRPGTREGRGEVVDQTSRDDRDRSRYRDVGSDGLQRLRNGSKGSRGRDRSGSAEWKASSRLEKKTAGDEGTSDNSGILALSLGVAVAVGVSSASCRVGPSTTHFNFGGFVSVLSRVARYLRTWCSSKRN